MLSEANIPILVANPADENEILAGLKNALFTIKNRVDGIYLHVDMDVLETEQGKPNRLAVPGGLTLHVVEDAIGLIKKHSKIEGCAVASYDPEFDENNCVLDAGIGIIEAVVRD